jgi:hypothetical protein
MLITLKQAYILNPFMPLINLNINFITNKL